MERIPSEAEKIQSQVDQRVDTDSDVPASALFGLYGLKTYLQMEGSAMEMQIIWAQKASSGGFGLPCC